MNTTDTSINTDPSTAIANKSGVEKNYYLIRTRPNIPLKDGVVGVGWVDADFSKHADAEAIFDCLFKVWGHRPGRNASQIRRFKGVRKGDLVVVPHGRSVAIGTARGVELYDDRYLSHSSQTPRRNNRSLGPAATLGDKRNPTKKRIAG